MKVLGYTNLNHNYNNTSTIQMNRSKSVVVSDMFVRSPKTDTVSFSAKVNQRNAKTIENIYRNLEGIHDPYSDVIMISEKKFNLLREKIQKRPNAESMVKLLSAYTEHMFPPEAHMFDAIAEHTKQAIKENPKKAKTMDFHDILQEMLPGAKARIKPEQLSVVVEMEEIASRMSEKSQKKLKPLFETTKQKINDDTFRIQSTIESLEAMSEKIPEKNLFNELIATSSKLPSSATSPNVFILKNANNSHEEIAEWLISPAHLSVEHIKAKSKGGGSVPANYIGASRRMNNLRKSLGIPELIRRFPKIPHQTQRYANDIIHKVNRGGLPEIAYSLPDVKETLHRESKGLIDINIDAIHPQIKKRDEIIRSKFDELVEYFGVEKQK